MADTIDETTVRRVAKLARLTLTDDEIALFAGQLTDIVAYFERLRSLDAGRADLAPQAIPREGLRDDEPRPSLPTDAALRNAAGHVNGCFKAPAVLEDASG